MLRVKLSPILEARLGRLARRIGRTKAYCVRKAISEFLAEREEYLIAASRLRDRRPLVSLDRVLRHSRLQG